MRLLNIETLQFTTFREKNRPKYVILSHRWAEDHEVTLEDVENRRNTEFSGYKKIVQFADYVKRHIPEIEWLWVDTCCIDKKDAVELSKSLNLMFGWYRDAELCIAYMSDVSDNGKKRNLDAYLSDGETRSANKEFAQSEWFRRGWTLQELLAPPTVIFVTRSWTVIGNKGTPTSGNGTIPAGPGLEKEISEITGIPEQVLHDYSTCIDWTPETKIQWMERRTTTEAEDCWYALFGILDVTPGANYGEGYEGAKHRLLAIVRGKENIALRKTDEFQKIKTWLAPPDPWINHSSARELHEPESGKWLLDCDIYLGWKTTSIRHLWMYGKAGSGKSVLCSTAIEDVKEYCKDRPESGYAAFYFTFSDNQKQRLVDLLRSLVAQLGWKGAALQMLKRAYDKPNRSSLGPEDLALIAKACFEAYDEVFLLLDALDECPEHTDNRHKLFLWLARMSREACCVKIMSTSRELSDIRSCMADLDATPMQLPLDLVNEDIRHYTVTQLSGDPRLSRLDDATKQLIEETITTKADGMFRWAYCQLQELKKLKSTKPSLVRKALFNLPQTLDETYERILVGISDDSRDDAVAMLRYLAFSESPPTLAELTEITTVIDWTGEGRVNTEDRPRHEDALEILSALVTVFDLWDGDPDEEDMRVRLAHFSVQEYLESNRIARGRAAAFHFEKGREHRILVHSLFAYLLHYSYSDERVCGWQDSETFPLLFYAAKSWPYHSALQQPLDVAREIRFLSDPDLVECWLMATPIERARTTMYPSVGFFRDLHCEVGPGLYYASLLGLKVVVSEYLCCGEDPNAAGGRFGNALQAASYKGLEPIVQVLLDAGADVDAQGGLCSNALSAACDNGNEQIVKLLLDAGANVNAEGHHYCSPLQTACDGGKERVVQMLLDAGANVNAQGGVLSNALTAACLSGHERIVQMLLRAGANGNASPSWRDNALQATCRAGPERILQMLLNAGADVNASPNHGRNALQNACWAGREQIAQMLIDAGADVNASRGDNGTALQAACWRGHERVVEVLIGAGATVDAVAETFFSGTANALTIATQKHRECLDNLAKAQKEREVTSITRDRPNHYLKWSIEEMIRQDRLYRNILRMLQDAGAILLNDDRSDQAGSADSANLKLAPIFDTDGQELSAMLIRPSVPGMKWIEEQMDLDRPT